MINQQVDIVASRLEFARAYAATDIFQPPQSQAGEGNLAYSKRSAAELRKAFGIEDRGGNAIDLVIDASGAEVSIQTGIYALKTGGTLVQVRLAMRPEWRVEHVWVTGWDGKARDRN